MRGSNHRQGWRVVIWDTGLAFKDLLKVNLVQLGIRLII
jgi:hypothetical protein